MYGVNMETVHMINRMEADARKKAMYYPELRKSAAMYRKRQNEKKQWKQLYDRFHNA